MHSYLVVGTNFEEVDKQVKRLAVKLKSQKVVFELSSIGDVRSLNRLVRLKVEKPTVIVVKRIDNATAEASNAFLKNLEEPQENIYYILTSKSEHNILPTILSRCQVVKVKTNKQAFEEDKAKIFLKMSNGEKLAYVSLIKKRDEAINFIENLILVAHTYLHAKKLKNPQRVITFMENAQKTLLALKANGNVSLQLTNFVLGIA